MAEETQVTETRTTTTGYGEPGFFARLAAIVGFIVVIIIVIWGLIHLASLLSPWFSSKYNAKPAATLQVQAPADVTDGVTFNLTWKYSASVSGLYSFIYPCGQSLTFATANSQGAVNSIPCGAAFSVNGNAISLTPVLSASTTVSAPLTIVFTPASGTGVQASATTIVHPGVAPAPAPAPSVTKKPAPVAASGPADLAVTMISSIVDQNGWATVVFDIANNGSGSSGAYSFQVYLPTRSGYTYYSPVQSSLAPGSHIVNTLRFTQGIPGTVSVIVDPSNAVNDSYRANNYGSQNLSMPYGYNSQPQYQYTAQPTYVY